ncbi:hypothetical protein [Limibacterium fermenti]
MAGLSYDIAAFPVAIHAQITGSQQAPFTQVKNSWNFIASY